MYFRILTAAIAAAVLVTGAPALANESSKEVTPQKVPACCERVASQLNVKPAGAGARHVDDAPRPLEPKAASPMDDDWLSRPPYTGP